TLITARRLFLNDRSECDELVDVIERKALDPTIPDALDESFLIRHQALDDFLTHHSTRKADCIGRNPAFIGKLSRQFAFKLLNLGDTLERLLDRQPLGYRHRVKNGASTHKQVHDIVHGSTSRHGVFARLELTVVSIGAQAKTENACIRDYAPTLKEVGYLPHSS